MGLDAVPPGYRETILLADVEEFSYQEIAEMMNVPPKGSVSMKFTAVPRRSYS